MTDISFDLLFSQIFGFISEQFSYFFDMLRHIKFLGVSIIWWFIILIIVGVIFGIIFRNVGDATDEL